MSFIRNRTPCNEIHHRNRRSLLLFQERVILQNQVKALNYLYLADIKSPQSVGQGQLLNSLVLFIKNDGAADDLRHAVRVAVACRPTILKVSVTIEGDVTRYADASAAMGCPVTEYVNTRRLVATCEATLVVLSLFGIVALDVRLMSFGKLSDGFFNMLQTALLPHFNGAEVAVSAAAIPISEDGLGIKSHPDPVVFRDSLEQETR